jgi:hypothetical protein
LKDKGFIRGGGTRNALTRVADKVGWPVNWWPTLELRLSLNVTRGCQASTSAVEHSSLGTFVYSLSVLRFILIS